MKTSLPGEGVHFRRFNSLPRAPQSLNTSPNPLHADRVFLLLIPDLKNLQFESVLANSLYENLKLEILKCRSILSAVPQVLCGANYDYTLEDELDQKKPSSKEILDVLAEIIVGDDSTDQEPREESAAVSSPKSLVIFL